MTAIYEAVIEGEGLLKQATFRFRAETLEDAEEQAYTYRYRLARYDGPLFVDSVYETAAAL